ncbi:hypothetical protein HD554DRAFT_2073207 [Boletus coccyginus]|nr:hypothetical protein HD554DRAFT_2073207 [Boletus coccyginus]
MPAHDAVSHTHKIGRQIAVATIIVAWALRNPANHRDRLGGHGRVRNGCRTTGDRRVACTTQTYSRGVSGSRSDVQAWVSSSLSTGTTLPIAPNAVMAAPASSMATLVTKPNPRDSRIVKFVHDGRPRTTRYQESRNHTPAGDTEPKKKLDDQGETYTTNLGKRSRGRSCHLRGGDQRRGGRLQGGFRCDCCVIYIFRIKAKREKE